MKADTSPERMAWIRRNAISRTLPDGRIDSLIAYLDEREAVIAELRAALLMVNSPPYGDQQPIRDAVNLALKNSEPA